MDQSELHEWSRHCDSIQWTVTAILTAAVGGLLIYSTDHFDLWLSISGMALTVLTVFFAASFRSLRATLHAQLPKDDQQYLRSRPLFRQWPVHVAAFVGILLLWLRLLLLHRPQLSLLWLVYCALSIFLVLYWGYSADAPVRTLTRPHA